MSELGILLKEFAVDEAELNRIFCDEDIIAKLSAEVSIGQISDEKTFRKLQLESWKQKEGQNATLLKLVNMFLSHENKAAAKFVLDYSKETKFLVVKKDPFLSKVITYKSDSSHVLGYGCLGTMVYEGTCDQQKVAVKKIQKQLSRCEECVLKKCRHENIVKYYGMNDRDEYCLLALELCLTSLKDYIEGTGKSKEKLQGLTVDKKEILKDAIRGLEYLHKRNIVHRDVKPENILLQKLPSDPNKVKAVLCDFGISTELEIGDYLKTTSELRGTPSWMAPEIICGPEDKKMRFSCLSDIFVMGCIIYYVLSHGKHPFGNRHDEAHECIKKNCYKLEDLVVEKWPAAKDLIEAMIEANSSLRPSATAALSHCYFWNTEEDHKFFEKVSDFIESKEEHRNTLEGSDEHSVIGVRWMEKVQQTEQRDLFDGESYDGILIRDLIRTFKEAKNCQEEGSSKQKLFTEKFPLLLIYTYRKMRNYCHNPLLHYFFSEVDQQKSQLHDLRQEMIEKERAFKEETSERTTREVELKTAYQNYIDQQETDKSKLIEEISKLKDELWNKQRNYEDECENLKAEFAHEEKEKENIITEEANKLRAQINDSEMLIAKLMKEKSKLQQSSVGTNSVEVQFDYLIPLMDNLESMSDELIANKKLFVVHGDRPQKINWEKYGLRISLQKDSFLSSETAEIALVALVGGQFEYPKNAFPVSSVYAISISKPLLKPLRLEMQHCVNLSQQPDLSQYLKFATAPVSTSSLPYQFSLVEGGEFTSNNWYGAIDRKSFSLVCILATSDEVYKISGSENKAEDGEFKENERKDSGTTLMSAVSLSLLDSMTYAGMIHYEEKGAQDLVTFSVAKNLNSLLQFIDEKHSPAEKGPNVTFSFQSSLNDIELVLDHVPQEYPCTGWAIHSHVEPCRLQRYEIDRFGQADTTLPASCLITVYGSPNAVPSLHYSVPLVGVAEPVTLYILRSLRTTPLSTSSSATFMLKLVKQAFRRQLPALTRLFSEDSGKAKKLAGELLSKEIISKEVHDGVIHDPKSLTKVLVDVIDALQPELLTHVIDVLQKDEAVAELMSEEDLHNFLLF